MARTPITRTQGHVLLAALLTRTTASAIAARCGVTPSTVSNWANLNRMPGADAQHALLYEYGIAPAAWAVVLATRRRMQLTR